MSCWSNSASLNSKAYRGNERWKLFVDQNPDVFFEFGDVRARVSDFDSYDDIKKAIGAQKGNNPFTSGIKIIKNGTYVPFNNIERIGGRKPGIEAQQLEALVALVALSDFQNFHEFEEAMRDPKARKLLLDKAKGISNDELDHVLAITRKNFTQGEIFTQVGIQARKCLPSNDYFSIARNEWFEFKTAASKLLHVFLGTKVSGDKWNPADICFCKDSEILKKIPLDSLDSLNKHFNGLVTKKEIIPVSVKQTPDAINGSRGIAKEIAQVPDDKSVLEFLKLGSLVGVPLQVNYQESKLVKDLDVQRRVLQWAHYHGKDHIEFSAGIAIGQNEATSLWYLVNNQSHYPPQPKKFLKLQSIVVSLVSKAVWFIFDNAFIVARTKGGGIQLSADKPRSGENIMDCNFKNFLGGGGGR